MPPRLIGPRLKSGAFYKKRPAVKKPRGKGVSQPIKDAIQRILNKDIETKFAISSLVNSQVTNTIRSKLQPGGTTTLNYMRTCMPGISNSGTASNDLIGTKLRVVSLKTVLHFNLDYANATSADVMVRVYFLQSRNAKNYTVAFSGLPGNNLQRTGSGTEQDWLPGTGVDSRYLSQLPLNTLAWTGTQKTFRLSKNGGKTNGEPTGAVPVLNNGQVSYDFVHDWKIGGKVLKYDEGDGSGLPENFLPIIAMVAWYADGTPMASFDQAMPVFTTYSNHLYYKDA